MALHHRIAILILLSNWLSVSFTLPMKKYEESKNTFLNLLNNDHLSDKIIQLMRKIEKDISPSASPQVMESDLDRVSKLFHKMLQNLNDRVAKQKPRRRQRSHSSQRYHYFCRIMCIKRHNGWCRRCRIMGIWG